MGAPFCDSSVERDDVESAPDMTEEEFLAQYDASRWPHPALTADIAVFRRNEQGLQLLMVKRGNHPYRGCWALPGGFFEPGEVIEQTAARELSEEAGIEGVSLEPFGVYTSPGRDPRDWVATVAFLACVPQGAQAQAGDDAADAVWFDVDEERFADGSIALALSNEGLRLDIRFTVEERPVTGIRKANVLESNGFAFDHDSIVADAWANVDGRV